MNQFLNKYSFLVSRRNIYIILLVVCVVQGLLIAYLTHDSYLNTGDNSTFYAFARSISNGEIIYKDFIHFRTPGSYWFQSLFIDIFGNSQRSVELAIKLETNLLYPLTFLISAMITFRKKNPTFVAMALVLVILLPAYAQLRAGFGLLAVSCFIAAISSGVVYKFRWLFGAGLMTGLTFTFGQEITIMAVVCILAGLMMQHKSNLRNFWKDARVILIGLIIGLLPLGLYILLKSDPATFFYYVTYYSFILQPHYMNVPYPVLSYVNFIYFIPFMLYYLCFVVLLLNPKLGVKEGVLLSFGILRLLTALGRSDIGHLLFAIPEIFIIVPYFMSGCRKLSLKQLKQKRTSLYLVILGMIFIVSIYVNGVFLLLAPIIVAMALLSRPLVQAARDKYSQFGMNLYMTIGATFLLFNFLLFPYYVQSLKVVKRSWITRNDFSYRISGIKTDKVTYDNINQIEEVVNYLRPTTIFSYPIQPYYYSFAEYHASRFFTFEPQTTLAEQYTTVDDLNKSKPEVVVFDPLQAQALSGSLWFISNYLTSNYQVVSEINNKQITWVMKPRNTPLLNEKLVFNLFKDNDRSVSGAIPIQNSKDGLVNAFAQQPGTLQFTMTAGASSNLEISISEKNGYTSCGTIRIQYDDESSSVNNICTDQSGASLILNKSGDIKIELINTSTDPILWNDVTLRQVTSP